MVIYYMLAFFVIVLDQGTKWLVVEKMTLGQNIPLIEGFLSFHSHRNTGAAWGMFEGKMTFFYVVTVVIVLVFLYLFHTEGKKSRLLSISLMLLIGGALGNFIDRVVREEVVDFIRVYIPIIQYDFPIFNVADMALTFGVLLLFIYIWKKEEVGEEQSEKV